MTGAAIILLVVVAAIAVVPHLTRYPAPGGLAADVVTTSLMIVCASASAICGTAGGPAHGVGLVIASCAAILAAITGGGYVVRLALRAGGVSPTESSQDAGPLRGGRVIGYLERLAVAATLLTGWPEGLAVILAVKSLARFPELRAPHASEQFIMGTFASVLWATGMSGIGYLIIH